MPPFFGKEGFYMTLMEAITQADETNRNAYSRKQKILWLSRAEAMVMNEVINAHDGGESILFDGYDDSTDPDTVLIMPQPYDEAYIHYLQAQVYYANDEIDRYNRAMTMFSSIFDAFKGSWKKSHVPKGCGRFRF